MDAYYAPASERALWSHHPFVDEGLLYLQDLSSQWVTPILNPQKNEAVLDLCAAPGGKTTHIAAWLDGEGDIGAVEAARPRFFKLKANVERMGASSVRLYNKDGRFIHKACPERFDAILLDAPCSTESCFHTSHPKSYAYWGPKKIKAMAKKQRQLLFSALQALKPGGRLLYVTCSFAPEENECVLQSALDHFDDIALCPITLPDSIQSFPGLTNWQKHTFDPTMSYVCRLIPTVHIRGLVMALIRRSGAP